MILVPVLPFPTHLFLHPSILPLSIQHSAHPDEQSAESALAITLFHFRVKTYLFQQSSSPEVSLSLPDCLHGLLPGPFLLSYSVVFPYFLVSVPCARLVWPSRQLLSARKYTLYRMSTLARQVWL